MYDMNIRSKPKVNCPPSTSRCCECNFVFNPISFRYYCCNSGILVCATCRLKICNRCRFARDRRMNIVCQRCKNTFNEDDTFFDFKEDRYYCPRCLAKEYIYHYDRMVAEDLDPKAYIVKINPKFEYGIEELIHFYKKRCFCCIKLFKELEVYEMKYGARICSSCLESNFDRVLPKLIMCVQCNGYLHDQTSIKFEISPTEVICVHCSKDEAKMYDAIQRKSVIDSNKGSKLLSKLASKQSTNSGIIVSVDEIERVRESGLKGEGHKMTMIVSRLSMEEESLDVPLEIEIKNLNESCAKCKSFFSRKSLFQLYTEEISRLRLDKHLKSGKKQVYICLECFNHYNQYMIKPKEIEKIRSLKTEKQLDNIETTKASLQSARQLQEPMINSRTEVKSPQRHRSPILKIVCQICKTYETIKSKRGMECINCNAAKNK